jgi:hypothetical protein
MAAAPIRFAEPVRVPPLKISSPEPSPSVAVEFKLKLPAVIVVEPSYVLTAARPSPPVPAFVNPPPAVPEITALIVPVDAAVNEPPFAPRVMPRKFENDIPAVNPSAPPFNVIASAKNEVGTAP